MLQSFLDIPMGIVIQAEIDHSINGPFSSQFSFQEDHQPAWLIPQLDRAWKVGKLCRASPTPEQFAYGALEMKIQ
jgi:hypothetical protein